MSFRVHGNHTVVSGIFLQLALADVLHTHAHLKLCNQCSLHNIHTLTSTPQNALYKPTCSYVHIIELPNIPLHHCKIQSTLNYNTKQLLHQCLNLAQITYFSGAIYVKTHSEIIKVGEENSKPCLINDDSNNSKFVISQPITV